MFLPETIFKLDKHSGLIYGHGTNFQEVRQLIKTYFLYRNGMIGIDVFRNKHIK